jgi:hypothetical protein
MAGARHLQSGEAVVALTTLNLAVLPVVAGLIAGTGALATYATTPGNAPAIVSTAAPAAVLPAPAQAARPSPAPPAASSCDAQTWPFIDASCATRKAAGERKVRLVVAPRVSDQPESVPRGPAVRPHVPAPQLPAVAPDQSGAPSGLTTSDTVLRSRDIVVPPPARLSKREKRAEQRRERSERSWAAQSYSVPGEAYDRRARPVIVVRPLRLEAYR